MKDLDKHEVLTAELAAAHARIAELEQSLALEASSSLDLERAAEEQVSALLEASPDPMFCLTSEGQYLYANRALAEVYGCEVESIVGKTLWDFFPREAADWRLEKLSEAFRSGREVVLSGPVPSPVGAERIYQTTIKPMRDDEGGGGRVYAICVARDISELKRAEAALRQSEEQYRALTEQIKDVVWILDTETSFFRYVSPSVERLRGYTPEEILAVPVFDALTPEVKEYVSELTRQRVAVLLEGHEPADKFYTEELQQPCKDGSTVWTEVVTSYYINPQNGHVEVRGVTRDISDRKRAEEVRERLEAQSRQHQKSQSLGRMAGAIAHHFNNQLQGVMGNLELALDGLSKEDDLFVLLSEASSAAQRAAELSSLMLTYLGQTQGQQRENLDLSELWSRSLPLLRAALPKNVQLRTELPSSGPVVNGNAGQLQQILANLVTNAWEACSDEQGVVSVSICIVAADELPTTRRFPLDWRPQDQAYACLDVVDSGVGISEGDFENLFDPFFTTKFAGRGMGLPVVLGIAKGLGGAIAVESKLRHGSTFKVILPLAVEHATANVEPNVDDYFRSGGTALVVEDEDLLRKSAVAMLHRMGFTVLAAKDGVEALEIFHTKAEEIDLVLCDLAMPRMNGWETLAALRQLAPKLPVIMASGYSQTYMEAGDHPERPQAYLTKPYRRVQLQKAVRQALVGET